MAERVRNMSQAASSIFATYFAEDEDDTAALTTDEEEHMVLVCQNFLQFFRSKNSLAALKANRISDRLRSHLKDIRHTIKIIENHYSNSSPTALPLSPGGAADARNNKGKDSYMHTESSPKRPMKSQHIIVKESFPPPISPSLTLATSSSNGQTSERKTSSQKGKKAQIFPWTGSSGPASKESSAKNNSVSVDHQDISQISAASLEQEKIKTNSETINSESSKSKADEEENTISREREGGKNDLSSMRLKKWRALFAVTPYQSLGDGSQLTVMRRFLGERTVRHWFKRKHYIVPISWAGLVVFFCLNVYTIYQPADIAPYARFCASLVNFLLAFYCWLYNSSFIIYPLTVRLVKSIDGFLFLVELILFTISLWGVFCFSAVGLLFTLAQFLSIATALAYDAFPVSGRKGHRITLILLVAWLTLLSINLLMRNPNRMLCGYTISLSRGLVLLWSENSDPQLVHECHSSTLGLNLPLYELCLNRAYSLIIQLVKITYCSFKYPRDCTLIYSRTRLVEHDVSSDNDLTQKEF